ncbi:MAG: hypothetical protein IKQ69_03010 [Oscillospiraceae bacterium]|nr:hypothetical protein [Oscillospiraceae bacterium]
MNFGLILTLVAFVFIAYALLSGKIPGSIACGVSVVVLWLFKVITGQEALANFVSSSIVTMVAMMMITSALMKTDILTNIASLVRKFKGGTMILVIASMVVPFILCQFVGGVTAMITVIPLAIALAAEAGVAPTLLVLPASVGAQAGLMALPIGTGAIMYMLKNQILSSLGITDQAVGFWDLILGRMPGTLVVFLFVIFFGWKLLPKRELADTSALANGGTAGLKKSTLPKWKQYLMYAIFIAIMVLLSIARNIGLEPMFVAVAGSMLVAILGYLNEREMFSSVNWSLIFFMSFMLAISTALSNSGAGELLAGLLDPVYGTGNTFLACAVTFLFCAVLTQVMDNNGLINILTPICALAAVKNGIPVVPIVIAIDASCLVSFSTPMASPSSLMAYKLGGYSMKEMLKFNLPLIAISTIVSILWIPLYAGMIG